MQYVASWWWHGHSDAVDAVVLLYAYMPCRVVVAMVVVVSTQKWWGRAVVARGTGMAMVLPLS